MFEVAGHLAGNGASVREELVLAGTDTDISTAAAAALYDSPNVNAIPQYVLGMLRVIRAGTLIPVTPARQFTGRLTTG